MKITKSQLRQIIREEISRELEEGPMDFMKRMMGPRDQGRTPETDWTVTLTNKAGKSGSWRTITVGAHSEEEAAQKAKAQMDDHETVSRVEKALGEAWEGDTDIKKMDKYGKEEMTKAELCAKRDKLKALKDRTEEQTTELRRINFALRSRQKGSKFGKVDC